MKEAAQARVGIEAEFERAELGDKRRTQRLVLIAKETAANPQASFPKIFDSGKALEATYRFMNNDRVSAEAIAAPHREQTCKRASLYDEVLVAHDTTEVNMGMMEREGLGCIGRRGKSNGFLGHFSLALAPDESRRPLGVLAHQTIDRPKRKKGRKPKKGRKKRTSRERQKDPNNESRRWFRGVQMAEEALTGGSRAIHIMDREGDSYALLAAMAAAQYGFVVRVAHDRCVVDQENDKLRQAVENGAVLGSQVIRVGKRGRATAPSYRKRHPAREAREATISISAQQITLPRPRTASESPAATLTLNLVRVFEREPPEGQPAVEWLLWTNEPIQTVQQVWRIVDIYRARWVIEEFFKVLKTGCRIQERQFGTAAALFRMLAIFIPIAWRLLLLRTLSHYDENTPVTEALPETQVCCLRKVVAKRYNMQLSETATVREALLAIARLGGHLERNGEPGWIILHRGYEKLLDLEEGYLLVREKM